MTALCLLPPTPAFKEGSLYECEPIPGGMVVYIMRDLRLCVMRGNFRSSFRCWGVPISILTLASKAMFWRQLWSENIKS